MPKRSSTARSATSRNATRAPRGSAPSATKRDATRVVARKRTPPRESEAAAHTARVQAYFAALPPDARRQLRQIRQLILSVAPGATEWFSYGVPGFRLEARPFIWYAAFKEHVSLYPMTAPIRTAFAVDLERLGLETSKGTIRFPVDRSLPATVIKRLVRARRAQM